MADLPPLLQPGDELRVIAPSRTWPCLKGSRVGIESAALAVERLESLGLNVTFGEHIEERDAQDSTTIEHRVADLHAAFADPKVRGIITVIGGFNANQLLDSIDYDLVRANPTVFCGYSDITVLNAAFLAKADLVTFYGPHISTFGMRDGIDYTLDSFQRALFARDPFTLRPSSHWSDDLWFLDQDTREHIPNPGLRVINPGSADAPLIGGHLSTLHLLQGTPYLPDLDGAAWLIEDTAGPDEFERVLQSILHSGVEPAALLVGRAPKSATISDEDLRRIVSLQPQLQGIPVVSGLDVGHTTPHACLPIGGRVRIEAVAEAAIRIG